MLISRSACPWCGSDKLEAVAECPYREEPLVSLFRDTLEAAVETEVFVAMECADCGVIFQRDILPSDAHVDMYEAWQYRDTEIETVLFYMQELLMIRSHFPRTPGEVTVFDYGMGWGKFCEVARTLDFDVVGFDINRHKRAHASGRGIRVIDELDAIDAGSVDFVNLEQVLEHVAEPAVLVRELASKLGPGGVMKISVPHRSRNLAQRLSRVGSTRAANLYGELMELWPLSHINSFTRGSLKRVLGPALRPVRLHLNSVVVSPLAPGAWRETARVISRPVYKNYYGRSNYLFFAKAA